MLYKKDIVKCHYYDGEEDQEGRRGGVVPNVLVSSGRRVKSQILYGCVI